MGISTRDDNEPDDPWHSILFQDDRFAEHAKNKVQSMYFSWAFIVYVNPNQICLKAQEGKLLYEPDYLDPGGPPIQNEE